MIAIFKRVLYFTIKSVAEGTKSNSRSTLRLHTQSLKLKSREKETNNPKMNQKQVAKVKEFFDSTNKSYRKDV